MLPVIAVLRGPCDIVRSAPPAPTTFCARAQDIWTLTDCRKHKKTVPRVLLRNGKRDKTSFLNSVLVPSQSSCSSQPTYSSSPPASSPSNLDNLDASSVVGSPSECGASQSAPASLPSHSSFATSVIMKEINIIKNELNSLKSSVSSLHSRLPSDNALRDEIACLRQSLNATHPPSAPHRLSATSCSTSFPNLRHPSSRGLNVTSWNCRGLSSAVLYLQVLADKSDIISISEHWLWPFELHTLNSILPGYSSYGCSDKRLSESSTLSRGCGGVAILWRSSLSVSPVTAVNSDRCVAVQVHLTDCSLSIISVYLPSSEYPLDVYKEHLLELENTISALQSDGPVLVTGDFNAHLGNMGGPRGIGDMNTQGQLLFDLISRTELFVASLCHTSSGPSYTFFNGEHHTTVDYCLLDSHAAYVLQECTTLDHHPLNLSDHLPVAAHLDLTSLTQNKPTTPPKINWKRATLDGSITIYQQRVNTELSHFSTCCCDSSSAERSAHLDQEIRSGAAAILKAAQSSLPTFKTRRRKKKYINDASLHAKCSRSKAAWLIWKNNRRPRSGPLYEEVLQRKKDIKSHVYSCRAREERVRLQDRDRLFHDHDQRRFSIPRKTTSC